MPSQRLDRELENYFLGLALFWVGSQLKTGNLAYYEEYPFIGQVHNFNNTPPLIGRRVVTKDWDHVRGKDDNSGRFRFHQGKVQRWLSCSIKFFRQEQKRTDEGV